MSLVSINREVQEELSNMGIRLTDEMYKEYIETGAINLNQTKYLEETTNATINGIIQATELGLSTSNLAIVSSDAVSDYFLYSKFDGGILSERLRDNAKEAQKIMTKTIKDHIKNKTTWKRLSKDLTAKKVSKGDLPKYLSELNNAAEGVIGNPLATKAEQRELKKLLKRAKSNVEKLAKGGAPTKELRAAYRKVIRAVENGELQGLKNQMDYAMQKKALYNNERISRTELSRADHMAMQRELEEDPSIETVRIILSDRHNVIDECDLISQADLYGLGKGVYPKEKSPYPPLHPMCLCSAVASSIKKKGARFSEERAREYFSKLPKYKREAMLQGGYIKDWKTDLKGYDGELNKPPKPLPKRLVKIKD